MKYIAPEVINVNSATDLIQGMKGGNNQDNIAPVTYTSTPGYAADE